MRKKFLGDDLFLSGETACLLYEKYAKDMPIFDFHCHLSAREIYEDKRFSTITEAWLGGDHYKWRLLREAGVKEELITGKSGDYEKFLAYATVMPELIGNPIYIWTHLELRRFFGIEDILSPETAKSIYDRANEQLKTLTARKMIVNSNVKAIITTDDPTSDLYYHKKLAEEWKEVKVLPGFRPDAAMNIERVGFKSWLNNLEKAVGAKINTFSELVAALIGRARYFASVGCVTSDHGMDRVLYEKGTDAQAAATFEKALRGEPIAFSELSVYKGRLYVSLGKEYAKRGWVQQYHIGAIRNNSARMYKLLGADTGYDSIGDATFIAEVSGLMSELDSENSLPKTILYCLNPRDNEALATLMNCFQDDSGKVKGKIQFGSGWWFNDQKDGMSRQMEALMEVGMISRFVGMLTDSRSFLSYTRHECFRRILCDKLGALLDNGEYPYDIEKVGKIVRDVCYNNAIDYFFGK